MSLRVVIDLAVYFFGGFIDFRGRCDRPRYWGIFPAYLAVFCAITFLSVSFAGPPRQIIFWGFLAVTFVPFVSLLIKRLHDINLSGIWVFPIFAASIVGIFGPVVLMFLLGCIPPTRGINKFGEDARGGNASVFD